MYNYAYPVKFLNDEGYIQDISLDTITSKDEGIAYETKANSIMTTFPTRLEDGINISDDDVNITVRPVISNEIGEKYVNSKVKPVKKDNGTIQYSLSDNVSYEYTLTYSGYKEDIVVEKYDGVTQYDFVICTSGLSIKEINGSYSFVDDEDKIRGSIGDVIIFTKNDSNNSLGDIVISEIEAKEKYKMSIVIKDEFLRDKKTLYPIRIDPTIEISRR